MPQVGDDTSSLQPAHTCLAYAEDDGFLDVGLRFLAAGLASGDRLVYVSGRPEQRMLADVAALDGTGQLVASGRLTLFPYDDDLVVVPEEQAAGFAQATEAAVAEGHGGLRVLAELTGLMGDEERRRSVLRYEHLAGRYMAGHPLQALCVVQASRLPDAAVADLEAVHPHVAGDPASRFRLLPDEDGLRLTGVVEAWDADRLRELLGAVTSPGDLVRLHLDGLDHVGVRGLAALADYRRHLASYGGDLQLLGADRTLQRAWTVLGLDLSGAP